MRLRTKRKVVKLRDLIEILPEPTDGSASRSRRGKLGHSLSLMQPNKYEALALQLRIPFDVSFASDSLMGASPN
jgi:hypothetical protein